MASRRLIVAIMEAVEAIKAIKARESADVTRIVGVDMTKGSRNEVAVASINAIMSLMNVTTEITGNSEATMAASSGEAGRTIVKEMASMTKMLITCRFSCGSTCA
jgi:hypothetical protein